MCRFLAARRGACRVLVVMSLARVVGAQTWNDSLSRALVNRAIARRAEQLADTGLRDYQATAHGYVTFLAQLGEGFRTPPKVIKGDELELEVYWKAPNQSKQIIVGRRDTLLMPTDIAYHRDHLGIVQNNFSNIIRIGEGDEVRDVPHPLSPAGLLAYDFALTDSFAIGSGAQRIHVYEVKVRPKDDRQPRVVGSVYIDPLEGQVVRMSLTFTRAALLDQALEDLSVMLENRLVGGRFWLPSRQEISIRRTGTWLDYPVRGIINGRWEIGAYKFNLSPSPAFFGGPEYVQLPAAQLATYPWTGAILDSLPPEVRAVTDADVERVQAEARELVRGAALARAQHVAISARGVSDIARFDRVEGLALGGGLSQPFGSGLSGTARARYGLDDRQVKGGATLAWTQPSGLRFRVFAAQDFRDVGDVAERSTVVNTLAAQEFGSDYTDPYLVRAVGADVEIGSAGNFKWRLTGSYERQSPLAVHAQPVTRAFEPTVPARDEHATRFTLEAERPLSPWYLGSELATHGELRATVPYGPDLGSDLRTFHGALTANIDRPFGQARLVSATTIAGILSGPSDVGVAPQELVYLGGPTSAPGYDYHSFVSRSGMSEHVEWRLPAPFVPFSLGRFGRVPGQGAFAPFVHVIGTSLSKSPGFYPSVGAGYLTPFELLRIDVARGLARGGRWTFSIDVSREFWSIL